MNELLHITNENYSLSLARGGDDRLVITVAEAGEGPSIILGPLDEGKLQAALNSAPSPELRRLVIAARRVAFEDQSADAIRKLDLASEAFATLVPWENEPKGGREGPVAANGAADEEHWHCGNRWLSDERALRIITRNNSTNWTAEAVEAIASLCLGAGAPRCRTALEYFDLPF